VRVSAPLACDPAAPPPYDSRVRLKVGEIGRAEDGRPILSHQFGNHLATNMVIWGVGLLIASRVRVLHVTLTYVLTFLVLAALRSAIGGGNLLTEVAPLTGPMYQLFIFFMITDPRTTVGTMRGRMVVAALVALAEHAIRLAGDHGVALLQPLYPSPAIFALAIVGPIAMWLYLKGETPRRPTQ